MKLRARAGWLVPVGLAMGCVSSPLTAFARQSSPLAELARQEQERRKAIKVPAKVYTDRDVKAAPVPPASDPTTLPPPVPNVPPAVDQKAKEPAKDQAWWKGRMEQAREELRRNEMFGDALQTKINSLTADFAARDDPGQRAKLADDRQKALAELARVKSEVEKLKKQVTDIEEEARKGGVPPGWLR